MGRACPQILPKMRGKFLFVPLALLLATLLFFSAAAGSSSQAFTDSGSPSGSSGLVISHAHPAPGHSQGTPGTAGAPMEQKLADQLAAEGAPVLGDLGHTHGELAPAAGVDAESIELGLTCPPNAPLREFNVHAINVDITLNRFGDHDPQGRMYVLEENIAAVRAQEQAPLPDRVSTGLRDDPIQPLIIRADLGDCVNIVFTNDLVGARASVHFHRGKVDPNNSGDNVGFNADSTVAPGGTNTYTVYIEDRPALEGAFYFHSHGDTREQTMHGLFGGLMAEPKGSIYLHPETGLPLQSGWEAVISNGDPAVRSFREQVLAYHEIGDEEYRPLDATGHELPVNDPTTGAYRPCARALNYRSECFMRRMELTDDASLAYSSYNAGDPASPMPRSYVGDPHKTRLLHGGSELPHVHHLHGGSIRWRYQPQVDNPDIPFRGFVKNPPDVESQSQRLDVQTMGPGETFNLEHECGAGGCQQTAGEFLFHCHIPDHYVAGMWSFWRVFNTLQPDLMPLPDRLGDTPAPVNSVGLLGTTLSTGKTLTPANIDQWVQSQLPPPGVAGDYDATVWDWQRSETAQGPLYLSEPEDTTLWANFASPTPGQRREIMFNPVNGRLAFPLLSPHLAKRPPFAPGAHSGAPYLSSGAVDANSLPTNSDHPTTPPDPDLGDRAVCPAGSPIKRHNIVAITMPIALNSKEVDPIGMIFVLAEEADDILAGRKPAQPLVIRVNVGDCVQNTLVSRLDPNNMPKVNIHPHFFQFDTQASDGVITGFSYEQSVRPYTTEDRVLTRTASPGDTEIRVSNSTDLRPGIWLGVGLGTNSLELHRIASIDSDRITLSEPLVRGHAEGQAAGVEFVRYNYYADVLLGTVFIHDHAEGLVSWQHGLVGTIIVEPKGSTYHHPVTGEEIRSGALADIHTASPTCFACPGVSFREMALLPGEYHDKPFSNVVGWFNMRSEPFKTRGGDPSLVLSSVAHGDPSTPLLRAYQGDPVVIHVMATLPNPTIFSLRVTGHHFHLERYGPDGKATSYYEGVLAGIAERFTLVLDGGAGPPGDYLYYDTQAKRFDGGMWGIFRVHDTFQPDLKPLPDRPSPPVGSGFPFLSHTGGAPPSTPDPGNACPTGAPVRAFNVHAVETKIVFNEKAGIKDNGQVFVLAKDADAVISGAKRPEPLVLRAAAGDCVEVRLTNRLGEPVSMHLGRVQMDPQRSLGITVGYNYDQRVLRGQTRSYRYYANEEVGTGIIADFAQLDRLEGMESGLYGAIAVAASGSRFFDPATGAATSAGWRAIVTSDDPAIPPYRDYVLLFHEEDERIGTNIMPYKRDVEGIAAMNYRTEPIAQRMDVVRDPSRVFDSKTHGDPETPLLEAYSGEAVRLHVLQGFGFQTGSFAINGHRWLSDPLVLKSTLNAAASFGPHLAVDAYLDGGAGMPGDYLYLNHRQPFMEAGQWGIFRVRAPSAAGAGVLPLDAGPIPGAAGAQGASDSSVVTGAEKELRLQVIGGGGLSAVRSVQAETDKLIGVLEDKRDRRDRGQLVWPSTPTAVALRKQPG